MLSTLKNKSRIKLNVVINTCDRPESLANCLQSLAIQTNSNFKVLVFDQSKDASAEMVARTYKADYHRLLGRNLSHSRNMGLLYSKCADIIAYIDDDARPAKDWTDVIISTFINRPELSGIGGRVMQFKSGRFELQYQNGIVSEYGYTEDIHPIEETKYNKGYSYWYARPMGTNMAFKVEALLKIGGFDEFFEYIHEETDVTLRLVKAGYNYSYCDNLLVYHYQENSHNRKGEYNLNWYVNMKNNTYFGLKNGSHNAFLRVLRTLKRVNGKQGGFIINLKLLVRNKISIVRFLIHIKNCIFGEIYGLSAGLFLKRKLLSK